jgi:hypothetical protein
VLNRLNFPYSRVEWFSIFEKFISPGVLKVTYAYDNKTFILELLKILRSSSCKWAVKITNFEKKNHGRVKILGLSKKQHGTFLKKKLLADSKNVHVLYVWRSNLTVNLKKGKNLWNFKFFTLNDVQRLKMTSKHTKHAHFWNQRAICY